MRSLLIFILLCAWLPAWAQHYDQCCFCLSDSLGPGMSRTECQEWQRHRDQKNCEFRQIEQVEQGLVPRSGVSCGTVRIWGAFHGNSSDLGVPALFARRAIQNFSAGEVRYDGSSCMVFNNVAEARASATELSARYPEVRVQLTANQNDGVVGLSNPLFGRIEERKSAASKVSFWLEHGSVRTEFAPCSKRGQECGHTQNMTGAKNDPNTKFCLEAGQVVEQSCCVANPTESWGSWSAPGMKCRSGS